MYPVFQRPAEGGSEVMNATRSYGKMAFAAVIATIGIGFVGALVWIWLGRDQTPARPLVWAAPPAGLLHAVEIRQPCGDKMVDSGKRDHQGRPVLGSCASCHDTRAPQVATARSEQLDEFHQGLRYRHGDLSCLSCHNAGDYNSLRRSDGRSLGFEDSMKLCAQCHGPQHRDYQNGSHGGMNGYWDLKRGPRQRNTCIDCHDPHQPAYPLVTPVFPPKPVTGETPSHHE